MKCLAMPMIGGTTTWVGPLIGAAPKAIANLGITLVPEGRRLFPKLTVEEDRRLGAYGAGARQDIPSNLRFCFEAFPILAQRW